MTIPRFNPARMAASCGAPVRGRTDAGWINWTITAGRLRFEGYSREQADRARHWIEERASSAVRYRVTSFKPAFGDAPLTRLRPKRRSPADATPIVQEYLDTYYREWLDVPVPALDGAAPAMPLPSPQCVRGSSTSSSTHGEPESTRPAGSGMPDYDFGWLWTELGLVRPEV